MLKYGHFQDCSLSFPSGGSDLQLILGPNEAGKSTTLAALSDLLFGFKPRTRFAFRFNQNLLRIGAVLEADGSAIEVCRRKGTGETLTGGDEKPLSERVLTAMLGGQRLSAELAFAAVDDRPDAAIAAAKIAAARSEMAYQAELYLRKRAEVRLMRTAIERYRQEKQGPLLTRASSLFGTLTLGRFSRLIVDDDADKPTLAGVRSDDTVVPVDGMSEGTVDQLYLALRVAAVEDAVRGGVRLPFLADDLFINFDDGRAAAGFKVLAELARSTQVLFFTHHEHLAEVANRALAPAKISVCGLKRQDIALLVAE